VSPREELAAIDAEIEQLEARRAAIYKASAASADLADKVCDDHLAELLSEPLPRMHYPVIVAGFTWRPGAAYMVPNRRQKPGVTTWVAVRPCDDTRTYLGVLVGDIATMLDVRYNSSAGVMEVAPALYNPAIWVPDLARLVFGLGSWWGE